MAEPKQGQAPWQVTAGHARLRLHTLVALRWRGVVAQLVVLLVARLGFDLQAPYVPLLALVGVSAASNALLTIADVGQRQGTQLEVAGILAFDVLQLSALLFLAGGVLNPFAFLLVAPVTLAAATVKTRYAVAIAILAIICIWVNARWAWRLPMPPGQSFEVEGLYRWGLAVAQMSVIAFTGSYAWRASSEAARMELALNVTQTVLAREQKLSALGALAAAAAHELGTPLATIQIVAKEIAREAAPGGLKEDAELLVSQAARCREILRRLTEEPEAEDMMHARLGLLQFVNEVIEPHRGHGVRVEAVVSGPPGEPAPEIRRQPEVLHAMTSLVENAVDFAASEVLVSAKFDASTITVEVRDDGPGFAPDVLAKLGQPYVTSRPGGEGSRTGHVGMGLGFFIAKTLLERSGAAVEFSNAKRGGAFISARWPRNLMEAPPAREFPALGG